MNALETAGPKLTADRSTVPGLRHGCEVLTKRAVLCLESLTAEEAFLVVTPYPIRHPSYERDDHIISIHLTVCHHKSNPDGISSVPSRSIVSGRLS